MRTSVSFNDFRPPILFHVLPFSGLKRPNLSVSLCECSQCRAARAQSTHPEQHNSSLSGSRPYPAIGNQFQSESGAYSVFLNVQPHQVTRLHYCLRAAVSVGSHCFPLADRLAPPPTHPVAVKIRPCLFICLHWKLKKPQIGFRVTGARSRLKPPRPRGGKKGALQRDPFQNTTPIFRESSLEFYKIADLAFFSSISIWSFFSKTLFKPDCDHSCLETK